MIRSHHSRRCPLQTNVLFLCLNFYFTTPAVDRSPRDSRELSHQRRDLPPEQQENGEEEEEELDEEGEMMKKIMGFSHFDSTKVGDYTNRVQPFWLT